METFALTPLNPVSLGSSTAVRPWSFTSYSKKFKHFHEKSSLEHNGGLTVVLKSWVQYLYPTEQNASLNVTLSSFKIGDAMFELLLEEIRIIVRMYSDSLKWYFRFNWRTEPRPRLTNYYADRHHIMAHSIRQKK